jgi:hypothetical protein
MNTEAPPRATLCAITSCVLLFSAGARADAVTDWNVLRHELRPACRRERCAKATATP